MQTLEENMNVGVNRKCNASVSADAHVLAYREALCEVYTDAAGIGISVGHIAEFWLDRWWTLFVEVHRSTLDDEAAWSVVVADHAEPPTTTAPCEIAKLFT